MNKTTNDTPNPTRTWGYASLLCTMVGTPCIALSPGLPVLFLIGYVFFTGSSITGIVHTTMSKDRPLLFQFAWFTAWNVIAIVMFAS